MTQIDLDAARQCQGALLQVGLDMPLLQADGPAFAEPWQAQAFAMTLALHDRAVFSWDQWAQALSESIKASQASGDPDTGQTYYHHWLSALEQMALRAQVVSADQLQARQDGWRQAAARTPHGQAIELMGSEKKLPKNESLDSR